MSLRAGALALAFGFAATTPARNHFWISAETYTFFSHFEGYANLSTALSGHGEYRTKRFDVVGDLRFSLDIGAPVFGNLSELLYRPTRHCWVGRLAPEASAFQVPIGTPRTLNQGICHTAFDCFEGGPIGVHAAWRALTLSIVLVNPPHLQPLPQSDEFGNVTPGNRWASPVIQTVDIDGTLYPLRNETDFTQEMSRFFHPGGRLRFSEDFAGMEGHPRVTFVLAYEISKSATFRDDQGLSVVTGADGEPDVVVLNARSLRFDYEQIYFARVETTEGFFRPRLEGGVSYVNKKLSGSGLLGAALVFANYEVSLDGGVVTKGPAWIYGQARGLGRWSLIEFELKTEFFHRDRLAAYRVRPQLSLVPNADWRAGVFAELVRADDKTTPGFEDAGPNDRIGFGVSYAL